MRPLHMAGDVAWFFGAIAVSAFAVSLLAHPPFDGCGLERPSWCYPGYQLTAGALLGFLLMALRPPGVVSSLAVVVLIVLFSGLESLRQGDSFNPIAPEMLGGASGVLLGWLVHRFVASRMIQNSV